ncbi:MnhB domain-containing protein [Ilumatobacter coccineus]|uniref:Na(+)/H(+) antiporter subunit B n=1 Tax=Ilumatobacter coccineus (strain NBRC 103263 / KCTC 29153 / YM16-304) TaxID=1313172 RepID=A0A6C7E8Z1_ILUCY|nr:MnhB domain-containing protein [Ilumatobacter coccineus]BAN04124.1 Na(+)/H(+) antiporter subunit B [Ilumatobacter coccineus YM16-304]
MRRLLVLDVSVRLLYPSIIVLSLYFLFSGHNQPGGGFVGGLTAAAAISLRYVSGGVTAVRRSFRLEPWTVLGGGLAMSVGTAIFPMLLGGSILEHGTFKAHPPLLGEVKATSALPFDVGVYFIVIGLVLMIFEAFGDDLDDELEMIEPLRPPATTVREEYRPLSQHAPASMWLDDDDGDGDAEAAADGAGGATDDGGMPS